MEGDVVLTQPQRIPLSPLIHSQDLENRFHEEVVVDGIFKIDEKVQRGGGYLTGAEVLDAHTGPQGPRVGVERLAEEHVVEKDGTGVCPATEDQVQGQGAPGAE